MQLLDGCHSGGAGWEGDDQEFGGIGDGSVAAGRGPGAFCIENRIAVRQVGSDDGVAEAVPIAIGDEPAGFDVSAKIQPINTHRYTGSGGADSRRGCAASRQRQQNRDRNPRVPRQTNLHGGTAHGFHVS